MRVYTHCRWERINVTATAPIRAAALAQASPGPGENNVWGFHHRRRRCIARLGPLTAGSRQHDRRMVRAQTCCSFSACGAHACLTSSTGGPRRQRLPDQPDRLAGPRRLLVGGHRGAAHHGRRAGRRRRHRGRLRADGDRAAPGARRAHPPRADRQQVRSVPGSFTMLVRRLTSSPLHSQLGMRLLPAANGVGHCNYQALRPSLSPAPCC